MTSALKLSCVSKVKFPKRPWRYLVLFQSWAQFQSWGIFVIGTNVLINSVLGFFESFVLPIEGVLIGTVLGSLFSVIMVLPTEFVVNSHSSRLFNSVTSELDELGYVLESSETDIAIYRQNLHRFLRWDEGQVEIKQADDFLVVKGPLMIIKIVRRNLLRRITN